MRKIYLFFVVLFTLTQIGFSQSGNLPQPGDIIFTQAGASTDNIVEFITLVDNLDLTQLKVTDNGITALGGFNNEIIEGTLDLSSTSWTNVPGGTFVRLGPSTINDNDPTSDRLISSTISDVSFSLNVNGDQIIAYTGSYDSPTLIAGINFASNAGWSTTGAIDEKTSYAPGTNSDVELKNKLYYYFDANTVISGDKIVVQTALKVFNNWGFNNSFPGWQDLTSIISDAALPVELTSFTATAKTEGVILNWSTATEVNNYGFEIEKNVSSNWGKIGFVEGHGNSYAAKNYSFFDSSPLKGKGIYRLKQVDTDGAFEYSDIVTVTSANLAKNELLQNHPNPFNPSTAISFSLAELAHVKITVYNAIGQKVMELANEQMDAGNHKVNFDGSNLSSGFYFYRLETANYGKTMKMILLR